MPTKRRTFLAAVVAVAAVAATPYAAQAAPADPSPAPLRTAVKDVLAGRYIVVYEKDAASTARDRVESGARSRGARIGHRYTAGLHGFAAALPAAALDQVRRDPAVAYVETDSLMHLDATASWGVDRINQRARPLDGVYAANQSGIGVHVYVIDSGVRTTHGDFGGRATLDANFVGDGRSDDCNGIGHGTHVSGTVGGATFGVARGVRIHGVRVFGCGQSTSPVSTIAAAVDWVTANAQRPAVVNMSLGGGASSVVDDAVNRAIASGITVVVSAGNSGTNACTQSPARVPAAITVANSTSTDARYSGADVPSNFGPCVDLFAPGASIVSASNLGDSGTRTLTGTSMASPHVAGVAALYLTQHANATPQRVRDAIVRNATAGVVTDVQGSPNLLLNSTLDSAADFNGDGATDVTVWRPSDGVWYDRGLFSVQWGQSGDVPVPGDYNGDGSTDVAVWRPSDGVWYVRGMFSVQWGQRGDVPVAADYNRDGITDIAVWRPSDGVWYVRGLWNVQWGQSGDVPVPADYNGDGLTEAAVWRPSDGVWYVRLFWNVQWGQRGDVPIQADYNGDGVAEVAVWRPSDGVWYVRNLWSVQWGQPGDVPVTGDFNADGLTEATVWRPSDGVWYVRLLFSVQWGQGGDIPIG
ncbi:S8 family serine peptidase [Actinomycetes bacterium KLBMP 9797]